MVYKYVEGMLSHLISSVILLIEHSPAGDMKGINGVRKVERPEGPAAIMAIGTANPPNLVEQSAYPDYYFRVTGNEHRTALKEKFRRICAKTMIEKRYLHLTEEILKDNPSICTFDEERSLDARQDLLVDAVPKLGKEAALKAIKEWGRSVSDITHLVFCSTGGVDMPGADYHLVKYLGLPLSVKRVMLYQTGCFAGGTVLRIAKDFAENNNGARVLVVCSELIALSNFRGPDDVHFDNLVGQSLFGDGAAALIVGADPIQGTEKSIFEVALAEQMILPGSDGAIEGHLREVGLTFHLESRVPALISDNIEKSLAEAFEPLGISDWNSIFWIAHPGGRAIIDQIEAKLRLEPEKLQTTRDVLRDFGNMSSACVFFILDLMRRRSVAEGRRTTGEGHDWGTLLGFGPGLTMEMVILRSVVPC